MNRIRAIRQQRAAELPTLFSIAAVAARVGVTERNLRKWEHGEATPRPRHARALARELGVQLEDLGLSSDGRADLPGQ